MAAPYSRIKQAILSNRGGFKDATMQQILTIWNALDEQTQHDYLKSQRKLNDGDESDADSS